MRAFIIPIFHYTEIVVFTIYCLLFFQEFYRPNDGAGYGVGVVNELILLLIFSMGRKLWIKIIPFIVLFVSFVIISFLINIPNLGIGSINSVASTILFFSVLFFCSDRNYDGKISLVIKLLIIITGIISLYMYFAEKQVNTSFFAVLTGPFENPNSAGMYFLSLMLLLINWGKSDFLYYILLCFIVFLLLLTLSRTCLLAAFIIIFFRFFKSNPKLMFGILLVVLLLFILLFYGSNLEGNLVLKVTEAGSSHRLDMWNDALGEVFDNVKNTLFGKGANTTKIYLNGHALSVHNSYINFFSDYGLISFILLISVLILMLFTVNDNLLVKSSFVIFIAGCFETSLFTSFSSIWITYILLYVNRKTNIISI
jgi:hypothetical protein